MTTILELPNELLLFVAESLPLSNVRDLRLACKRFHHILKRINRRRVVLYDIEHLPHLEDVLDSLGDKYTNALYVSIRVLPDPYHQRAIMRDRSADDRMISACKIVAASVLPPVSTASPSSPSSPSPPHQHQHNPGRAKSIYDILAKAPELHYFSLSLLPFSDVNISFVPPFDLSSSAPLSSLTHLSIVNFRISQSFLAAFPRVVQVTLALVLEPEENAQMQLQYTPRDLVSFTSTAPRSIERFTVTVTNITPDLVQVVAERLPRLTHLSFVWYPETDVAHGGVEITDASQNIVSVSSGLSYFPVVRIFAPLFPSAQLGSRSPLARHGADLDKLHCCHHFDIDRLVHLDPLLNSAPTLCFHPC